MNTTLLIMAAGIGSRFGTGIKQLEPVVNITVRQVLPQLSVLSFLYYRKYSIINISKDMREAVKCQVHTVHYV